MSKRVLHHPDVPEQEADLSVWRSVREHEDTIKFRHQAIREFQDEEDTMDEDERELSRRNFVKLMGASTALAGLGLVSCRRPESYILPYADGPEWIVPGRPLFYATTMPAAGGAIPLVATTYESRPTKLAPNAKHPDNMGTDAMVQASITKHLKTWQQKRPSQKHSALLKLSSLRNSRKQTVSFLLIATSSNLMRSHRPYSILKSAKVVVKTTTRRLIRRR